MKELVIASNNSHKIEEIKAILPKSFTLLSLKDIGLFDDIPETADTFDGNAILKAEYVKHKTTYDCFADDSGLEVEALNGAPGVYSARYGGKHGNHALNNEKLLKELAGVENRKAQFRSVIALIYKGNTHIFEGIVKGKIIHELTGQEGFGYDPLFMPYGYDQTFAEMDMALKNTISHRGRAVKKMMEFLRNETGEFRPGVEYC